MADPDDEDRDRAYTNWSDRDLLRALTVDVQEYAPREIASMRDELASRGLPDSERQALMPEIWAEFRTRGRQVAGVGGFLLLLIVMLGMSAVGAIVRGGFAFSREPLFAAVSIGFGAFSGYCCWLLARRHPSAPRQTRILFVTVIVWDVLYAFPGFMAGRPFGLRFVWSTLLSLLWLLYLSRSKRVALTYAAAPVPAGDDAVNSVEPAAADLVSTEVEDERLAGEEARLTRIDALERARVRWGAAAAVKGPDLEALGVLGDFCRVGVLSEKGRFVEHGRGRTWSEALRKAHR